MSQTKAQLLDGSVVSVAFSAGSAATPSLYFAGDLNTGIYSPGADQVAVATNGTRQLDVNSSGQFRIGNGGTVGIFSAQAVANGNLHIRDIASVIGSGTGVALDVLNDAGSAVQDLAIRGTNTIFRNSAGETLRITSAGLVGIGTSSPAFALDISASTDCVVRARVNSSTSAGFIGSTNNGTNNWFFGSRKDTIGGNSGTDRFNLLYDTNAFLTVTTAGNVGIGTTSPGQSLSIVSPSTAQAIGIWNRASDNIYSGIYFKTSDGATDQSSILNERAGTNGASLLFYTKADGGSTTERLRIDSSGRVGIGTTVANSKLSIGLGSSTNDGLTLTFTGDNSTVARFFADTATGQVSIGGIGASYFPVFYAGAAEKARIDTSGRLLVGTSSARSNFFNGVASAALQLEGTGTNRRAAIIGDDFEASLILASQKSGAVGGNTVLASGDPVGAVSFQGNDGSEFVEAATITAFVDGTPGANDMPGRLVFSTTADGAATPTERVRIDSSGRLLVGTSTALLLGSSLANFAINTETLIGGGVLNHNLGATRHGGPTPEAGPVICLARSRGTTIGAVTLVANGDTLGVLEFSGADGTDFGTTAATIRCEVDGTPGANDMPGRLVFSTTADGASSPTERMRITSSGGVKASDTGSYVILSATNSHEFVQTTAGAAAFHAYHTANTGLVYGYYFKFVNQNPNDTTAYVFTAVDNTDANIYTIWSNGTVATRSDAKFKKNIETTRNGYLEDLAQLRVVKYNWYNHEDDAPKELGFIAQEVEQVFPGLVATAPDKDDQGNETGEVSKSIKTSVFTPMLVKALQEALERIETLETEVAALKAA